MASRIRGFLVASIMLLCGISLSTAHELAMEVPTRRCSREKSRKTRQVLNDYLFPFLAEFKKANMSTECVLQPHRDLYREQEQHKREVRRSQWKCLFCTKVFRNEMYLDKHMDNRHNSNISKGAEVCLADYCDVVHCQHDNPVRSNMLSRFSCKTSDMARRRHHCEAIAHKCFPPEQGSDLARLNDFFVHQFCDAHTCSPGRRLFPDGAGGKPQFWLYAGIGTMVVGLSVLYLCVYFTQRDIPKGQDFRRVKQIRKPQSWLAFLGLGGKKKKVY